MIESEPETAQGSLPDHEGRLLTPVQVADFLHVKLRRVFDLVKARRLRPRLLSVDPDAARAMPDLRCPPRSQGGSAAAGGSQ